MNVITKDVHEDLQKFFSEVWGQGALQSFLYYFRGHGKKAYSEVKYVLMTNTGIRLEVDGKEVDYKFSWKYAWRFSSLNQSNNQEDPKEVFMEMVQEGKRMARENKPPKWKTMSRDYYKNGRDGETLSAYNTYNGSKSNF